MSWQPKTLGQVFEKIVLQYRDTGALVTPSGRLTYKQLFEKAQQAAGGMQALGIGHGDHVGILMGNDEKWLALFYGAALIGAVTVPVNTRFKAAEIELCLKQSDCKALFYVKKFLSNDYAAMLREIRAPKLEHVLTYEELPRPKEKAGNPTVKPQDPLLIQFTSGTTAYPKGVILTHDNMLRDAWAAGERIGVRPEDRYFNCRPFFHAAGSTLSALMALTHGCALATLPTFARAPRSR